MNFFKTLWKVFLVTATLFILIKPFINDIFLKNFPFNILEINSKTKEVKMEQVHLVPKKLKPQRLQTDSLVLPKSTTTKKDEPQIKCVGFVSAKTKYSRCFSSNGIP